MDLTQVIKKPVITEKSMRNVVQNQYTFEVDKHATKKGIAQAVEDQFNVEVYRVTVMNRRGKKRRNRRTGRDAVTPMQKRAVVTINPKDKIEIFEVSEEETK